MVVHILGSRWLTVGLLISVIVVGLAFANGAGTVFSQEDPRITNTTALLTTNRSELKVCVESLADGVKDEEIRGRIMGAMTNIASHPDFRVAGLGDGPVSVETDCPGNPTIYDPAFFDGSRRGAPELVSVPSTYRLFVFVAPPEQVGAKFNYRTYRTTQQERFCDGPNSCGPVTHAVYFTPNELSDAVFLEYHLTHGVGLWPVDEPRPEDEPQSEPEKLPEYPAEK